MAEPAPISDAVFARRAYLDVQGLLPPPEELRAFLAGAAPGKRAALVMRLLSDNPKYAEHWISYWNDLLRNDEGVTFSALALSCLRRASRAVAICQTGNNCGQERASARIACRAAGTRRGLAAGTPTNGPRGTRH